MTWLAFRVEVWTSDEREDSVQRMQDELLRAVRYRFGASIVKRQGAGYEPLGSHTVGGSIPPHEVPGYLDRLEANRKE